MTGLSGDLVDQIIAGLKEAKVDFAAGLPDGWLLPLHVKVREDPDFQYVRVPNEGIGVSICVGAWLGGKTPVMMMENSGLRVASETIARLCMFARIPVLLLMSYRGDVGETEYWGIQHGVVMEPLLKALRIPYKIVRHRDELRKTMVNASNTMNASLYPVAVVIGGELVW